MRSRDHERLEQHILDVGLQMLNRQSAETTSATGLRRFKAMLGVSHTLAGLLWIAAFDETYGTEPKHLLWSLMFLKLYSSENVLASIAGVDEKTFRKWTWHWVRILSELNIVRFSRTFN